MPCQVRHILTSEVSGTCTPFFDDTSDQLDTMTTDVAAFLQTCVGLQEEHKSYRALNTNDVPPPRGQPAPATEGGRGGAGRGGGLA